MVEGLGTQQRVFLNCERDEVVRIDFPRYARGVIDLFISIGKYGRDIYIFVQEVGSGGSKIDIVTLGTRFKIRTTTTRNLLKWDESKNAKSVHPYGHDRLIALFGAEVGHQVDWFMTSYSR